MRRGELEAAVADLLRDFAAGRAPQAALQPLAERRSIRDMLGAVVEDRAWLLEVADRSYRHALGFDKVILVSALPAGQLRLHVWWPETERIPEHAHNHRFSFASCVVAGRMRNTVYRAGERTARSAESVRYTESAVLSAREWSFTTGPVVHVEPEIAVDMPAGTGYVLARSVIHTVEALAPFTLSIFLETAATAASSSVYVHTGQRPPASGPQHRFTPGEVRSRLERVLDQLPAGPATGPGAPVTGR
jgi:hypothetical protein